MVQILRSGKQLGKFPDGFQSSGRPRCDKAGGGRCPPSLGSESCARGLTVGGRHGSL